MPKLRAIVALGRIAHESTVKALGLRSAAAPFAHGAVHQCRRLQALRQLSLLALQHEHRRADARDVSQCVREGAGGSGYKFSQGRAKLRACPPYANDLEN